MPCDTIRRPRQTLAERKVDVRKAVEKIETGLVSGKVTAKVGPQGAVAFTGIEDKDRDGVTDACVYRQIMLTGSATARTAIARAEILAGRTVDRKVLAQGTHSHDGGRTWGRD